LHRFSENRIFTDADDYSLEIELPVGYFSHARQCPSKLALHSLNRKSAECPQNIAVFGHLTRKDIDTDKIFFNAVLQDTKFRKVGAVTYYNAAGMSSNKPFEGLNIVVTRYTDGKVNSTKAVY